MQNVFDINHIIVTFSTTTDAMAAETAFKSSRIQGRLVPVPSNIKAGCGMCWYAIIEHKNSVIDFIKCNNLKHENIVIKES